MAKEEELKRVELKVNVSCCEGCRRKVMRAMSLKGVLRTEIHPSLERVTVVGNVDAQVLVRKLAKVGKIAEPVSAAAQSLPPKRRDADGDGHGGAGNVDKPAMAMALVPASVGEKTSKRKDDDGCKVDTGAAVASNKKECSKCAHQQGKRKDDDAGDRGKKAVSKDLEEGDAFGGAGKGKPSSPEHEVAQQQYYHRAEPPSMAVPVQYVPAMPYYAAANVAAAPGYYGGGGGYYAMPPPPPVAMPWRPEQQQLRPQQPSRFDVDYFNEDNAVGCRVM